MVRQLRGLIVALVLSLAALAFNACNGPATPANTPVSDPAEVQKLAGQARTLLGADMLEDAEPVLSKWCELQSSEAEPFRLRMFARHRSAYQGKTESERQRLQELALADGLRALELNAADDATSQEVVFLALAVGRFEEADRVCQKSRERRPNDAYLKYLQARVRHGQGKSKEAESLLDDFLGEQPNFARGLLFRATLYIEAEQPDQAIPLLRQVMDQDQGLRLEARHQLSLALSRAGQSLEAQQIAADLQRQNLDQAAARSGHADLPAVQTRRAELLLSVGKTNEALEILQAVLKLDTENPTAHGLLAAYYEQRGEAQKAAEHRRKVSK